MDADNTPHVWVLQGHRKGDNAQALELARLLGWPFEKKQLVYTPAHALPNLLLGASLVSRDRQKSDPLTAPWPSAVIAVGKRTVPIALWIKKRSGGATRLIHIGRPRATLASFDLVITTPQYGLPHAKNVYELPLPLVPPIDLEGADAAAWAQKFAVMPRPWTGVMVGGNRYPSVLAKADIKRLMQELGELEGSALISTSPRTGAAVAQMRAHVGPRTYLHDWSGSGPNPHQAILALADRFIVTSDSVSMIAEAVATGKPVEVFKTGRSPLAFTWPAKSGFAAWLARTGLLAPPRSPDRISLPEFPQSTAALVRFIRQMVTEVD